MEGSGALSAPVYWNFSVLPFAWRIVVRFSLGPPVNVERKDRAPAAGLLCQLGQVRVWCLLISISDVSQYLFVHYR